MDFKQRQSESGQPHQPTMQVVGFHVEGQTPSPPIGQFMTAADASSHGPASPVPVIIPPSFQVRFLAARLG